MIWSALFIVLLLSKVLYGLFDSVLIKLFILMHVSLVALYLYIPGFGEKETPRALSYFPT